MRLSRFGGELLPSRQVGETLVLLGHGLSYKIRIVLDSFSGGGVS